MKNIIFDICGVLFDYKINSSPCDYSEMFLFEPIEIGHQVVNKVSQYDDVQLFILSNSGKNFFDNLSKNNNEFFGKFKGVVLSENAGFKKPDIRMYQFLVEEYNLLPQDCLMIDDKHSNVEAAKLAGMSGVHFDQYNLQDQQIYQFINSD